LRPFWSAKFILRVFGVQNLFCVFLECKIYFAVLLECKIYFACFWSALLFCRAFGVQNLFCRAFGVQNLFCNKPYFGNALQVKGAFPKKGSLLILGISKITFTKSGPQNKFCTPSYRKINFALQAIAK
jgi:hypothetical protein